MADSQKGSSLTEMLMVVTILGTLALMVVPRIERGLARRDLVSTRVGLASVLQRARIAALQLRRPVLVSIDSATVSATASTSSGTQVVAVLNFHSEFGVLAQPTASSLTFQPTGVVLSGTPLTVSLGKAGLVDSVSVIGYGRIQ